MGVSEDCVGFKMKMAVIKKEKKSNKSNFRPNISFYSTALRSLFFNLKDEE